MRRRSDERDQEEGGLKGKADPRSTVHYHVYTGPTGPTGLR